MLFKNYLIKNNKQVLYKKRKFGNFIFVLFINIFFLIASNNAFALCDYTEGGDLNTWCDTCGIAHSTSDHCLTYGWNGSMCVCLICQTGYNVQTNSLSCTTSSGGGGTACTGTHTTTTNTGSDTTGNYTITYYRYLSTCTCAEL